MKKINIGLIGAGWIGGVHSECYKRVEPTFNLKPGTINLYTIADIDEELAKDTANRYGYEKLTTDWKEVVEDEKVDLIDICVSNFLHYEIAMSAAQHKKNIFCEKPLAINVTQAAEMVKAVDENNLKAMINYNYRKVPAIVYLKQMIESGELGEIYNFRSFIAQDFAADSMMPISWRFKFEKSGGGSVVTMGNHVFDMARFLIGDIDRLVSDCKTIIKKRPINDDPHKFSEVDVDDLANVMVRFKNEVPGFMESCWTIHGRKHFFELEVYGSKGSVIFVSERLNELKICEDSQPKKAKGFKDVLIGQEHPYGEIFNLKTGMGIGIKESFVIQLYDMVYSILNDKNPTPNFRDGYESQKITEAVQKSSKERCWIKV